MSTDTFSHHPTLLCPLKLTHRITKGVPSLLDSRQLGSASRDLKIIARVFDEISKHMEGRAPHTLSAWSYHPTTAEQEGLRQLADISQLALHKEDIHSCGKSIEVATDVLGKMIEGKDIPDSAFFQRLDKIHTAVRAIEEILSVSQDYELDEIQQQSLISSQGVLVENIDPSGHALESNSQAALARCIVEVNDFIINARQYDLEEHHINALEFAAQSMQERIASGQSISESSDPTSQETSTPLSVMPVEVGYQALELLRQYRAAPKFSNDHAAIKRTVALEDRIDEFLASLDPEPTPDDTHNPKRPAQPR